MVTGTCRTSNSRMIWLALADDIDHHSSFGRYKITSPPRSLAETRSRSRQDRLGRSGRTARHLPSMRKSVSLVTRRKKPGGAVVRSDDETEYDERCPYSQ